MRNIEEIGAKLKQFIEETMEEAIQLNESIAKKKAEIEAKDAEINDVREQLEYMAILMVQLEDRLDMLLEEKRLLLELLNEREGELNKNRFVMDNNDEGK